MAPFRNFDSSDDDSDDDHIVLVSAQIPVPKDEQHHTCKQCPQKNQPTFKTHAELVDHKAHVGHDYCKKCDLDFNNRDALEMHILRSNRHISCFVCSKEFRSESGLSLHMQQIHRTQVGGMCPKCHENFPTQAGLLQHIEGNLCPGGLHCDAVYAAINEQQELINEDLRKDDQYGDIGSVSGADSAKPISEHPLRDGPLTKDGRTHLVESFSHFKIYDPREESDPFADSSADAMRWWDGQRRCYICPYKNCGKKIKSSEAFQMHLNSSVHSKKNFSCPGCKKRFASSSAMLQHVESGTCRINRMADYAMVKDSLTGPVESGRFADTEAPDTPKPNLANLSTIGTKGHEKKSAASAATMSIGTADPMAKDELIEVEMSSESSSASVGTTTPGGVKLDQDLELELGVELELEEEEDLSEAEYSIIGTKSVTRGAGLGEVLNTMKPRTERGGVSNMLQIVAARSGRLGGKPMKPADEASTQLSSVRTKPAPLSTVGTQVAPLSTVRSQPAPLSTVGTKSLSAVGTKAPKKTAGTPKKAAGTKFPKTNQSLSNVGTKTPKATAGGRATPLSTFGTVPEQTSTIGSPPPHGIVEGRATPLSAVGTVPSQLSTVGTRPGGRYNAEFRPDLLNKVGASSEFSTVGTVPNQRGPAEFRPDLLNKIGASSEFSTVGTAPSHRHPAEFKPDLLNKVGASSEFSTVGTGPSQRSPAEFRPDLLNKIGASSEFSTVGTRPGVHHDAGFKPDLLKKIGTAPTDLSTVGTGPSQRGRIDFRPDLLNKVGASSELSTIGTKPGVHHDAAGFVPDQLKSPEARVFKPARGKPPPLPKVLPGQTKSTLPPRPKGVAGPSGQVKTKNQKTRKPKIKSTPKREDSIIDFDIGSESDEEVSII